MCSRAPKNGLSQFFRHQLTERHNGPLPMAMSLICGRIQRGNHRMVIADKIGTLYTKTTSACLIATKGERKVSRQKCKQDRCMCIMFANYFVFRCPREKDVFFKPRMDASPSGPLSDDVIIDPPMM